VNEVTIQMNCNNIQWRFNRNKGKFSLLRVIGLSVGLFVVELWDFSFVDLLPIDDSQFVRAAKEMIAEHGDAAKIVTIKDVANLTEQTA
jgi:hypothetical protein